MESRERQGGGQAEGLELQNILVQGRVVYESNSEKTLFGSKSPPQRESQKPSGSHVFLEENHEYNWKHVSHKRKRTGMTSGNTN